jgi:hypothetical protein
MAKNKSNDAGGKKGSTSSASDKYAKALRDAGQKASELAQNPVARSMLAAGLVAAAAALTANQKVRSNTRKAMQDAADNAEAAADTASKVGAAIVTAATEAVRKMMGSERRDPASKPSPDTPLRRSSDAPAAKTAKPKAKTGTAKSGSTKAVTAKPAAKKAVPRAKAASAGSASAAPQTAKSATKARKSPAKKAASPAAS